MPLPRFRLRTLMIVVAVVGVAVTGVRLRERSLAYGRQADRHTQVAEMSRRLRLDIEADLAEKPASIDAEREPAPHRRANTIKSGLLRGPGVDPVLTIARDAEGWGAVERYHAALAAKYRRAARYPWLPVVPDPPWIMWLKQHYLTKTPPGPATGTRGVK